MVAEERRETMAPRGISDCGEREREEIRRHISGSGPR